MEKTSQQSLMRDTGAAGVENAGSIIVGWAGVTRGGLFDSAVDGSGSGEVKREKGAESLGRGSRMEA